MMRQELRAEITVILSVWHMLLADAGSTKVGRSVFAQQAGGTVEHM